MVLESSCFTFSTIAFQFADETVDPEFTAGHMLFRSAAYNTFAERTQNTIPEATAAVFRYPFICGMVTAVGYRSQVLLSILR